MTLVAVGVTSASQSISLSNFTPRIENLPQACQTAYTTTIDGCSATDFNKDTGCSNGCVQGLVKISKLVTQQCGNVDVPETSIIGVFLLGKGIEALCPNIVVTTIGSSSTQASKTTASSEQASSTTAAQTTQTTESTSSSSTAAATSVASSPNNPVAVPSSSASLSTSKPPAAKQTTNGQKSNQDSGGGSPFDVQAAGSSTPVSLCALTAMLGIAVVFTAFL